MVMKGKTITEKHLIFKLLTNIFVWPLQEGCHYYKNRSKTTNLLKKTFNCKILWQMPFQNLDSLIDYNFQRQNNVCLLLVPFDTLLDFLLEDTMISSKKNQCSGSNKHKRRNG